MSFNSLLAEDIDTIAAVNTLRGHIGAGVTLGERLHVLSSVRMEIGWPPKRVGMGPVASEAVTPSASIPSSPETEDELG